jgi:ribonuclease P protein component
MKLTVSLNQNRDFKWLYARGKSAVGVTLAVYVRPNRRGGLRLGLTAGTKIGNAVHRNRARRRVKEAYRLLEPRLKPGHDLVVVARVSAYDADFGQIRRDLEKCCGKLSLLRGCSP